MSHTERKRLQSFYAGTAEPLERPFARCFERFANLDLAGVVLEAKASFRKLLSGTGHVLFSYAP